MCVFRTSQCFEDFHVCMKKSYFTKRVTKINVNSKGVKGHILPLHF